MQLASRPAPGAQLARSARAARPTLVALPARRVAARAKYSGVDTEELKAKVTELGSSAAATLKEKWEATEDKPAAVLVTGASVIALSLALSIVNIVDKIPLVSDVIELVGIAVTGWFTYRYLTVGPDRDELFVAVRDFVKKVYNFGSK